MIKRTLLMIIALLFHVFAGCVNQPAQTSPKIADLGVVEVSNGGAQRVTSKDGRVFMVDSFFLKDKIITMDGKKVIVTSDSIFLRISKEEIDSNGVAHYLPYVNIAASPGKTFRIPAGKNGLSITPIIKP